MKEERDKAAAHGVEKHQVLNLFNVYGSLAIADWIKLGLSLRQPATQTENLLKSFPQRRTNYFSIYQKDLRLRESSGEPWHVLDTTNPLHHSEINFLLIPGFCLLSRI